MKKFLFIIAAFATLAVQAQTNVYHPFPDSSAQWNIHMLAMSFSGPPTEEFYSIIISGDTLINSLVYHKLTIPYVQSVGKSAATITTPVYRGAIRQEIANRKVFIVPPSALTEQLLYDFNLQAGDTVRGYIESWVNPNEVVLAVDSVMVGNSYHKRWMINAGYNIYFIEGVGSTYGLIEFSPGNVVDVADFNITCFRQNGQTIYPDTTSDCSLITGIDPVIQAAGGFTVMPNPCQGSFTLEFGNPAQIAGITLTDMAGKVIRKEQVNGRRQIIVSNLLNGSYLLTVTDGNNNSVNRKIISCP